LAVLSNPIFLACFVIINPVYSVWRLEMLRRRINTLFCMKAVICLVLTGALPVFSASTMPFTDDFESYADGTVLTNINNWFTSAYPSAIVVNATSYSGTNHVYLDDPDATLSNVVNGAGATRVWTDMFVKVTKRDTAPVASPNLTAVFYFNTNGYPVACDGVTNNWIVYSNSQASTPLVPVDTNAWTRITVVHKYNEKKWALFVNNVLVRDSIGFLNLSASEYNSFTISNITRLDSIRIAATHPDSTSTSNTTLTGDVDVDGMPDYWEILHFNTVSAQGANDDYDGDGRSSVSEFSRNTDPTNANSFALNLPYRDGFESAPTGIVASVVFRGLTNSGTVVVTNSAVEGSRAIGVKAGRLNAPIADQYATNVWLQIYAKPTLLAGTPPDPISSQVIGFCVTTSTVNNLKVYSGSGWVSPDVVSNVPSGAWLGFAAHLDYGAKKWQLYVSTNGLFGDSMRRVNAAALDFNAASVATCSNLTHITITNRSVSEYSYVDVLAATPAYTRPTVGTYSNVTAPDRLAGTANPAVMPPYVYADPDNTLTGAIGDDLAIGLMGGDKLEIFFTNGWNVYNLNVSTNWAKDSASSMNPGDLHLQPSMGLVVKRGASTGGVDTVVFYPFDLMPTNSTTNLTIYGVADTTYRGWNLLASPFTDTRIANGSTHATGFGFQPTNYGDRIYFPDRMLHWSPTGWREGSRNSTYRMVPGELFWYYHKGTGMVWNVVY
jgi:hypothetical protein